MHRFHARRLAVLLCAGLLSAVSAGPAIADDRDRLADEAIGLLIENTGPGQAESLLGILYLRGMRVESDPIAASGWLERAAAAGHPAGVYVAARMYAEGIGVAPDPERARRLLGDTPPAAFGPLTESVRQLRLSLDLPADGAARLAETPETAAPVATPVATGPAAPSNSLVASPLVAVPQEAPSAGVAAAEAPAPVATSEPAAIPTPAVQPVALPTPVADPAPAQAGLSPAAEAPATVTPAAEPAPATRPAPAAPSEPAPSEPAQSTQAESKPAQPAPTPVAVPAAVEPAPITAAAPLAVEAPAQPASAVAVAAPTAPAPVEAPAAAATSAPTQPAAAPAGVAAAAPATPAASEVLPPLHAQLATLFSEKSTVAELARLQERLPAELMAGKTMRVQEVKLADGRTARRILAVGFATTEEVKAFCAKVRAKALGCLPRG